MCWGTSHPRTNRCLAANKKGACEIVQIDDGHANKLPDRAKRLWAKTPRRFGRGANDRDADAWLPLYIHMADSAEVAARLWETWLPPGLKTLIADDAGGNPKFARRLFLFLAAAHDIGKATPAFQQKSESLAEYTGLRIPIMAFPGKIPHGLAGHCILKQHGFDESVAVVIGGHHGKPPTHAVLHDARAYTANTGLGSNEWEEVQNALLAYAYALSGTSRDELRKTVLSTHTQALLTGLVIMTDWIASDENRFEYISLLQFRTESSLQRASSAWDSLRLPPYWQAHALSRDAGAFFRARFGVESPRPVQTAVLQALAEAKAPGIVVIEAPMGEGKTEAALAAAELLAEKSGRGGVFVGLPTMATSDGMFGRVKRWVNALADGEDAHYAMFLAHGKSHLNDEYNGLKTEPNVGDAGEESAVVNDWFCGRKKGVLADFVVGTVDQLLFMALKARHAALRHLAFAYKVVIVDECHAYDAYMNRYLFRALEWLGQYRTPVVILSATLPGATRRKLIEAYLGTAAKAVPPPAETPVWLKSAQNTAETAETQPKTAQPPAWAARTEYPMITYSDGDAIKQISPPSPRGSKTVRFEYLPDAALPDRLCKMLSNGGCAGVICNTVSRAQEVMRLLAERFAETELELIHARFLGIDRMRKENALRDRLGPPGRAEAAPRPQRLIVVGTQVLEQSLDIDFDLLISDIAPMDLLLQRIGRLHRHARARPAGLKEALCFVTGVEDAAEWRFAPPIEKVYSPYMLLNTLLLLPVAPDRVSLPEDISPLVQAAYEASDEDDATCAERSDDATARAKLAVEIPPEKRAAYDKAKNAYKGEKQSKEDRADVFRLRPPAGTAYKTLLDWLDIVKEYKGTQKANALNTAASSIKAAGALQKAEASVRDTADSLEVAAVQRKRDGKYCLLPWIGDKNRGVVFGAEIPTERIPDDNVARVAAACTVSLPMQLCGPQIIDKVICELERQAIADRLDTWQESYWLAGLLPLILDENLQAEILGYTVRYCEQTGLSVTRKED